MPNLALDDAFERLGEWHLPSQPNVRVAGRLSYSNRRVELELNEALTPVVGDVTVVDEQPSYELLLGTSTKGELLSVLRASRVGVSLNFGGVGLRQPERLISSWLVVGAHVEPNQRYSKVQFVVPGLAAWLNRTPISQTILTNPPSQPYIETITRQTIQAEKTDAPSVGALIEWGAATTGKTNPYQSISIDVHGYFTISHDDPQPIEWFFDQQGKLATLLLFLAGTPMPPSHISAYVGEHRTPLSLLVALRAHQPCELGRPSDFFVPRASVSVSLNQMVSNWFANIDPVLTPSQLAASTLSSKDLWLHVHFASLIQSLEGFHRGRHPGLYMAPIDYEKVRSAISNSIPTELSSDHKEALRSRIKYGNQISLAKRLAELAATLGPNLAKLILGEQGKVPRSWIDTRNYHSHWDDELLQNILGDQDMYNANVRMEHFLRALFLMLAGVKSEEIVRAIEGVSSAAEQLTQINIIDRHKSDPSQPKGIYFTVHPKGADAPVPSKPDELNKPNEGPVGA